MKRFKELFIVAGIALATLAALYAANHKSVSLINGTNAIFYIGTADTATTFDISDAYSTNRTYVNPLAVTTTPKGTNSTTGALNPNFNLDVDAWANANGDVSAAAITVAATANSAFTNTAVFTFVRSVNGTDFDTTNPFEFTFTPSGTSLTILTTNLPAALLNGSRTIRWQKVKLNANPTDNGNLTVNRIALGGFVP